MGRSGKAADRGRGIKTRRTYAGCNRDYQRERPVGRTEGRKEGRKEGREQIVLNMLKEKADIAFISKVTGLSEKEIRKLQNQS